MDKTRAELLHMWSQTQMRAAYWHTQQDKVNEILYTVEEAFREEARGGEPVTMTVRGLVTALREAGGEIRCRWQKELRIEECGI